MPIEQERFEQMVAHAKKWVDGENLAQLPLEQRILYTCSEAAVQKTLGLYNDLHAQAKQGDSAEARRAKLQSMALEAMFYQTVLDCLITGRDYKGHGQFMRQNESYEFVSQIGEFLTELGYKR